MAEFTENDRKFVEYAAINSVIMEKAAAIERQVDDAKHAASLVIPKVVEAMINEDLVDADQGTKLAAHLADHATALEILLDVAGRSREKSASLGRPTQDAPAKKANAPRSLGMRDAATSAAGQKLASAILGRGR